MKLSPLNRRRLQNFKRNRRGYFAFWIFLAMFFASMGSEFICNERPLFVSYKGEWLFPVFVNYPEDKFGGFEAVTDYRDPVIAAGDRGAWLHSLAADPLRQQHDQTRSADAGALAADLDAEPSAVQGRARRPSAAKTAGGRGNLPRSRTGMARDRRQRTRRRRAAVLRLPHLRAVRPDSREPVLGDRRRRRGGARLFRRPARSRHAARHRDLVVAAAALHPHHSFVAAGPEFWRAADDPAAVFLGQPRPCRARRILARAQFRVCQRRAGARPRRLHDHRQTCAAERHGGDADVRAVHRQFRDRRADLARFPGIGDAAGLALARRVAVRGRGQYLGAVAALSAFFIVAIMLSLLVFIGEAVRDAFDPRKTFA